MAALSDCDACLELNEQYFKAVRTRARVYLAQEQWDDAVRDFERAYEMAPAGSADEAALKGEVRDAKAKLKRSKMKVRNDQRGERLRPAACDGAREIRLFSAGRVLLAYCRPRFYRTTTRFLASIQRRARLKSRR